MRSKSSVSLPAGAGNMPTLTETGNMPTLAEAGNMPTHAEATRPPKEETVHESASIDAEMQRVLADQRKVSSHPERFILGKPNLSRAKQFNSFAALRGYDEMANESIAEANISHDFIALEDSC